MKRPTQKFISYIILPLVILSLAGCNLESESWFKLVPCNEFTDITYNTFTNSLWAGRIGNPFIYELDRSAISSLRTSCLAITSDKLVKRVQLPFEGRFWMFCDSGERIKLHASINDSEKNNPGSEHNIEYDVLSSTWTIGPAAYQCGSSTLTKDKKGVALIADAATENEIFPNAGSLRASYYEDGILLLIDSERSVLFYDEKEKETKNLLPDYRAIRILLLDRSGFWFEGFKKGTTVEMVTHSNSSTSKKFPTYTLYYYRFSDQTLQTVLQVTEESGTLVRVHSGKEYQIVMAEYLSWTYTDGKLATFSHPIGIDNNWDSTFDPATGTLYFLAADGIYSRVVGNRE